MSNANYKIVAWSPEGEQLDILTAGRFEDLSYSKKLNDIGRCDFTINIQDPFVSFIEQYPRDIIVDIFRDNILDASYFLRYPERFAEEDGNAEFYLLEGVGLETILRYRYIVLADDPVNAGGYLTRSNAADQLMYNLVRYQTISPQFNTARTLSQFNLRPLSVVTYPTVAVRYTDRQITLLKSLQDIQKDTQQFNTIADFRIVHDGEGQLWFEAQEIGLDRTETTNVPLSPFLLFAPERRNLIKPRLKQNYLDEVTVTYVAGQGAEEDRVFYAKTSSRKDATPWNWRESVTTSNESTTLAELDSAAQAELTRRKPQIDLQFDIDIQSGASVYKTDFDIGDRVTVAYGGYSEDHRIIEIIVNVTDTENIDIRTQEFPNV